MTTAINYANGAPHMGHAYEALVTDVVARYHRLSGKNLCGIYTPSSRCSYGDDVAAMAWGVRNL